MATGEPRPALRDVALAGDRRLVIREAGPDDVEGLISLYDRLDAEARHRRFFSMYRPGRQFVEHLVQAADRGGASLVAEVLAAEGGALIVGEAEFELLPDGDGELAITVDAAWRGWLGPYLLDALIEVAADRGVPNLEADLLVGNGPMRALLRARGDAVMPHDDWSTLRVIIGTSERVPSWPPHGQGLKVLIEGSGNGRRSREAAETAGVRVLACGGPIGRPRPCPMLSGRPCPLAADADVIVVSNPPDDERWDTIRARHEALHPGVPVCVELRGTSHEARSTEAELGDGPNDDLIARARAAGSSPRAPDVHAAPTVPG